MPFLYESSNPSDPSDPSNFSTPLSPPGALSPPPRPSSSSTTSPTLPSISTITHSLLQTALSLKRDFRFLKLTTTTTASHHSSFSPLDIAIDNSDGIHKLLQTSLYRLNSSTRNFVRDADTLLDEEVNKSFDAYLHGRLHRSEHFGDSDSGCSSPLSSEGGDDELEDAMMMTVEEKETRRELQRLVGVVEELRGAFFKKAGKYVLGEKGGRGKDKAEEEDGGDVEGVEDLVMGKLDGNGEGDGEKEKVRREDEDIKMGLERLAERLRMGKREEVRVCRV
ncbi:hypothetical protein QBC45DRAFT_472809 [Copromyces sp. CBS 386.78]|nr:hypothetical protein QBC45DRAFT_472809 [Copromyces sp. CBS 386.78]